MTNDVVEPSDHELTREERNHLKAWILDCDEEGQSYDSELLKKLFRATLTSTQGQAAPSAENKDAISEQHSDLADELDVERLADLMQEEPFSGDQHVEGTTDHRQRLEHYASLALRSNRAAIVEDNPPTSATFNCGRYDDGSGPKVEVRYDFDGGPCSSNIWIEQGISDQWFAFSEDVAEEVCAAIMKSAQAIRSLNGGDHD